MVGEFEGAPRMVVDVESGRAVICEEQKSASSEGGGKGEETCPNEGR
jgi:hypothetical protein